jgi:hypothetical protein
VPAQKPRSKADPRNKAAAVPAAAPVAKADDNKAVHVPMAFALPELPTGGTLATWKSDLARIKSISVSKDNGATWITVQGSGKISIPEDQRKAVTFLGLSRISSPTSDRGMAYRMWAHQYHDLLLERLGKYSIKIEFGTKSIIGGYLFSVQDALSTNESEYKFLAVSLEKFQPRKREATVKADTEVVYDLVL